MKTKPFFFLLLICVSILSACGLSQAEVATQTAVAKATVVASWTATPTLTPTLTLIPTPTQTQIPTPTPDPCLSENLPDTIEAFNEIMVRFDDASILGFYLTRKQLPEKMPKIQSLRQVAQEQTTPPCLETLKKHQLKYMDLVIIALTAHIDGQDAETHHKAIIDILKERDEYSREIVSLLNDTLTPEAK